MKTINEKTDKANKGQDGMLSRSIEMLRPQSQQKFKESGESPSKLSAMGMVDVDQAKLLEMNADQDVERSLKHLKQQISTIED